MTNAAKNTRSTPPRVTKSARQRRGKADSSLLATKQIQLRVSVADRELIDEAAKNSGMDRTKFMLSVALQSARDQLMDRQDVVLSPKHFQQLCDALDSKEEPSKSLKALLAKPRPWV